jgi:putative ABC transport system ATP-binding protein
MLKMKNINKSFITDEVETKALCDINIEISEGEFVAIIGSSGSGKTTFLNIAGLLDPADSGEYMLNGQDILKMSDNQRSLMRREQLGFIFQGFNLLPDLTIAANVELPLRLRGVNANERKQAVENALKTVGLASRASHFPAQLSGGQQQRVAIARAIVGDSKILFADEPTGNLDTNMSNSIFELLKEINAKGTTIVMVTHDLEHAKRAKRRIHIRDGKVLDDDGASLANQKAPLNLKEAVLANESKE